MEKLDFNKMDAFGLLDYISAMENDATMSDLSTEEGN